MQTENKNYLKYVLIFIFGLFIRFIPFRPPNIEPVLTIVMPFSKKYGNYASGLFALLSIVIFDLLTSGVGIWTVVTSLVYSIIGYFSSYYFRNRESNKINYLKFAFLGTIIFDIITGLLIGPLFFNQPFMNALIGQIPFTILHLLGNMSFAYLLSPLIYRYIINNKKLETPELVSIFTRKHI